MNSVLKIILNKATEYKDQERITPIIDVFYTNLTVVPIQRATLRSKYRIIARCKLIKEELMINIWKPVTSSAKVKTLF